MQANREFGASPGAGLSTHLTPFLTCNPAGQMLFSVQAGVPADEAASRASACLGAAIEILEREEGLSDAGHGAAMLIRLAKALLNALRLDQAA